MINFSTSAGVRYATLPATPARLREQIKLQVARITPLMHIKGYAAPETQAAAEQARLLIEQAEALGEPPEDPLALFSVLYGFWAANLVAFNGDVNHLGHGGLDRHLARCPIQSRPVGYRRNDLNSGGAPAKEAWGNPVGRRGRVFAPHGHGRSRDSFPAERVEA